MGLITEILAIEPASGVNKYRVTVAVNSERHTFVITVVEDDRSPMLGISGDEEFYRVFGREIGQYRPILEKVGEFHAGLTVALPVMVQPVLPAPQKQRPIPIAG